MYHLIEAKAHLILYSDCFRVEIFRERRVYQLEIMLLEAPETAMILLLGY